MKQITYIFSNTHILKTSKKMFFSLNLQKLISYHTFSYLSCMFYAVWYFLKHSTCSGTSHFSHANDVRPSHILHRLYLLPVLKGQWLRLSNLFASVISTAIEDLLPCLLGFVPWRRRRVWATSLWKERRSFSPLFQDLNE